MARLRSEHLDLDSTLYYHCVSRCVRRAFLCGRDPYTGRDFEHRKEWIEERILKLAQIFAVDLHAYAVMSNHLHIVVRVDPKRAESWTDREVQRRYAKLFRFAAKEIEDRRPSERRALLAKWRERLSSLSWLMRCLNEAIARRANREDECTGRFWEGRFRCQPLLDESALLTCMAYVDLNPVRAGVSKSADTAENTSLSRRLRSSDVPTGLTPFADQLPKHSRRLSVPMALADYAEFLRWMSRCIRSGRSDAKPSSAAKRLLADLGVNSSQFVETMGTQGLSSASALGSEDAINEFAERHDKSWVGGKQLAQELFS
ncbi:MAG: transposase [Myxococcota bacterium]